MLVPRGDYVITLLGEYPRAIFVTLHSPSAQALRPWTLKGRVLGRFGGPRVRIVATDDKMADFSGGNRERAWRDSNPGPAAVKASGLPSRLM